MKTLLFNEMERTLLIDNLRKDLTLLNEDVKGKHKWKQPMITALDKLEQKINLYTPTEKFLMLTSIHHYDYPNFDVTELLIALGDKKVIEQKREAERLTKYFTKYNTLN